MIKVPNMFDPTKPLGVHPDTIIRQTSSYQKIVREAEQSGLIVFAYSGVVLLMHPQTQLDARHYHNTQIKCGGGSRLKPWPEESGS